MEQIFTNSHVIAWLSYFADNTDSSIKAKLKAYL